MECATDYRANKLMVLCLRQGSKMYGCTAVLKSGASAFGATSTTKTEPCISKYSEQLCVHWGQPLPFFSRALSSNCDERQPEHRISVLQPQSQESF